MPIKTNEKSRKSKAPSSGLAAIRPTSGGQGPSPFPLGRGKGEGWPGTQSTALFEEEQKYIAPGIQSIALLSKLTIEKGQGAYITDVDGNEYLDFNVGVSVCSLGYSHPKYIQALRAQLDHITVGSFTSKARLALMKLIASITPGGLRRTQLFSSGAEAVEAAFRLAKSVTKKRQLFGFWGGYHGKTAGTLPLSMVDWKHEVGPLPTGYHQAPYPDCYRCPFKLEPSHCGMACVDHLRKQIKEEAKGDVAAIIAEPVQGTAGNIVPPDGFISAIREVAREVGALYISDEMITGFGRTGYMFGVNHDSVSPDVMTIGKAMGSGFPVSGVITTDEHAMAKPWSLPSASSSSYGGNPLASAATLATIETIIEEKLVENSRRVGQTLLHGLKTLQSKYSFIGDVRGRGLMIGFDLVMNPKTKEPMSKPLCEKFFVECLKRGLIMMGYTPRVRIHPPLNLSEREALEGVAKMDEAFAVIAPEVGR